MNATNQLAMIGAEVVGTVVILASLVGVGVVMVRFTVRTLRRWGQP